ncbi:MAG: amidohydrolase family protein [Xanthobacteraceae bacterium]|nr:amidohydrolase family protein [Xanthobacteraceae bacterium]
MRRKPTRRTVLKSGVGLATAAAVAPLAPGAAQAQGGFDPELAGLRTHNRAVLKGGIVLSLDPKVGDFAPGDVAIENGRIVEVRPNIDVPAGAAAIVDATNRIIIPGFVDTHSHSYQGLLRSSLANGLVDPDYNRDVQNKLTPAYTPDDVYIGVLITALGFIEMGTTAIVDLSQISHTPEHSDACIRALQHSGIRAVYGYSRGAGAQAQWPQDIGRLQKEYFSSKDQLLTLALGASLDAKVLAAAREVQVPAVMHYRVNAAPGLALGKAGVLREGDLFIHCTHLNDDAWRMIKDTGGRISMSPPLEMAMAHGMPSVQDALDRGIRPSLSSDHGTTVAQDCFSMMRTTFNLQRLRILQRRRDGEKATPPLLTCRDVLEFATLQGARCANLDHKIGTLTPGKEADIVMLRADRLDVWPINNAPSAVANMMNPSHVENVLIAGKPKKWRGHMLGLDFNQVMQIARARRDDLMKRTNHQIDLLA